MVKSVSLPLSAGTVGLDSVTTHHVDSLSETGHSQILMLPHKGMQPSTETKHVGVVVSLFQTDRPEGLQLVPTTG